MALLQIDVAVRNLTCIAGIWVRGTSCLRARHLQMRTVTRIVSGFRSGSVISVWVIVLLRMFLDSL